MKKTVFGSGANFCVFGEIENFDLSEFTSTNFLIPSFSSSSLLEKSHQSAFPLSVIGLAVTCIFATNFASAQPLTIRDDYSDTTSESLQYDQIDFLTGSKANVAVTIGGDQTQSIVLDKGINLDDESGSASVDMTLSADSIRILGGYGINYGTSTIVVGGNDPGEKHILNVIADELTVNATTALNSWGRDVAQSALSVNASSTVNLGAEENRISSVTLTADGTHAVYVGDNSAANVFADSIVVTTNATSSTYAGIYVTGDAAVNLNALNNITINNANGYGIDSYGTGSVHLTTTGGSISVNAAKASKAINFRTLNSNNDDAEMSLEGKSIFLTGRVDSTGSSSETSARLTLAAEDTISIDAESSSYGAVQLGYRRYLDLSAENIQVKNKVEDGELKGFGFKLDGSGTSNPTVDASFGNEFSIKADTGVYLYATNAAFTASGEAADQSLLSITGSLAGFVAKNSAGQNRIEDTSVDIVLNKNTAITDNRGPTGQNGMVGIYNAGCTKTTLQNGKYLKVNISATDALSGKKVIGMLADATTQTGLLTIQNYDLVSLDLTEVDSSATVYGIRSVSSKTELKDVGTFKAKVNSGYAVYASSYTSSSTKYAQGSISIDADSVDVEAGSDATAFYASDGGAITVNAHNQVVVDAEGTNFIYAEGEDSKVEIDASEATTVRITGDITATGKATASLSFNSGSFTGSTNDSSNSNLSSLLGGTIHLTLGGENSTRTEPEPAQWNVTDDSVLTSLSMNSAVLNLAWRDAADALTYKSVAVKEFGTNSVQGGSGDLYFNIDLETEAEGTLDQLEAENVSGTYTGHVNFDNPKDLEGKLYTENYLIHQEAGSMQVNNPDGKSMSGDGMMSKWSWKFRPADLQGTALTEDDLLKLGNTSEGEGDWILVRDTSSGSGEGGGETPPESEQIKNLGSSVAQAIGWLSEKNDLRRRLGEVRYGSQTGAWAKVFTRQDRADGFAYNGFKQNSTGVHIGYDTFASKSESSSWLVGATLRYARADQEGIETAYGGDGKTNEYSGKLYATWMHEKGSYLDALVQVGYYDQEIRGRNNSGTGSFDADYHNIGMGASVEIGHMFTLSNGADDRRWFNHWFIEPQLELSYFYVKGQNFKTSTGLKVEQGDADFLTGRAGLVIGKKFNYGTVDDLDRRYFQIGLIGGINHEFLGDQEIRFVGTDGTSAKVDGHGLGGTSFYYGLTADWQVANRIRIYAELDAEEGEHYTKDYGFNIGLKYAF